MGIDNISNSNSINRSLIEQNKDLSKEEKENLLSIFDAVDEQEEDNQKGTITTFDSMNKFLGQIKENIGDKYNKFLDSINLSFLKNDKNANGVVDKRDFSDEDLKIISQRGILTIFEGQEWTKETAEVISAIINPQPNDTKIYKTAIHSEAFEKNIIFDSKNRELKLANIGVKGVEQYESYRLDNKNRLIEKRIINEGSKKYNTGKNNNIIGEMALEVYAYMQGFESFNVPTQEACNKCNQIFNNYLFGYKYTYEYNSDGTLKSELLICSTEDGGKQESITKNGIVIETIHDNKGQFVSKQKIYPDTWEETDEGDVQTIKSENYDENNNLLYITEEQRINFNEPIINYNNEGFDANAKIIITKTYPDGRKEITTEIE